MPLEIRPFRLADWPAVGNRLEPVVRAGETFPHDPAISEAEARSLWVQPSQAVIVAIDADGVVVGGHLCAGSLVRTTAEVPLAELPAWRLRRSLDPATGYRELQIGPMPS